MTEKLPSKLPTVLYRAEFRYATYTEFLPAGVTFAMASDPNYWQHVAAALKRHDVLEVIAQDNTFEAKFRVTSTEKGALRLRNISLTSAGERVFADVPAPAVPTTDALATVIVDSLKVEFIGADKWRVVDEETKQVIARGLGTKKEAEAARDNVLAARKAA